MNRIRDERGELWFVQPAGAPPSVLQHRTGVPQVRSFRRLQLPAPEALSAGAQVGVLEWWAGPEQIGTQTLVVR
jgi:hypothetical protein